MCKHTHMQAHTHAGNIHQRLRPFLEDILRLKREHCVSLPLLILSFLFNIPHSLLLYTLLIMFVNLLWITLQYLSVKGSIQPAFIQKNNKAFCSCQTDVIEIKIAQHCMYNSRVKKICFYALYKGAVSWVDWLGREQNSWNFNTLYCLLKDTQRHVSFVH